MADVADGYDWGDDPFSGDMDFDSDFDRAEKHGFIRSFATGFLSGLVEKTVGDTDARIDTLKMVLPKTWGRTFQSLDQLNRKRREITQELKGEIHGSIDDLQYLAKRAGERLQKSFPNKIGEEFIAFSKNDYSSWENNTGRSGDNLDGIQSVEQGEVDNVLNQAGENSLKERETAVDVGNAVTGMMAEVGGRTIGGLNVINQQLSRSNSLLEGILDYQRKVQARNDAMKLTLAARHFITDSKYYKFQEAAQHRIIRELKAISINSAKSDYEKTTHSQAARKSIRDTVFTTVKSQFGGISDYFSERFGKGARSDGVSAIGEVASSLRMALEMTEGMEFNFGSMLGNAAAGMFINSLPRLVQSGKAREALDKFKKRFPQFAKQAEDAYIRIEDLGNVTGYGIANAEGMVNTLRDFQQGTFSSDEDLTYDDYLDRLPDGTKPMGKYEWTMKNIARKAVNKGSSKIMEDMYATTPTQYNLARRTLKDNFEVDVWRRKDSRALTEVIPELLSAIELSLEKMRTGDDTLKARSYDYVRGKLIDHKQKVSDAFNRTFNQNDFRNYADMAMRSANQLDPNKELSEEAKKALAMELIKQQDRKKGFSPYNFMEMSHLNPNDAAEIKALMQRNFGITDELFTEFKEGDETQRIAKLNYLPTESGREMAANVIDEILRLGRFAPELAENIDISRNSGYYNLMKEWGMTKTEHGRESMDEEQILGILQQFINDPTKRITRPDPTPEPYRRTRPFGAGSEPFGSPGPDDSPIGPKPTPEVVGPDAQDEFQETLKGIRTSIEQVAQNTRTTPMDNKGVNLGPYMDKFGERVEQVNTQLDSLISLAGDRNGILSKLLETRPMEGGEKMTKEEAADLKAEKLSIMDRLKQTSFKDLFNKGMDNILKHEPLVLGGLLGGLAGMAIYNPKAAAIAGTGFAAAMAYGKFRSMAQARSAANEEDLFEEGSDEPILAAWKLKRGDYYDLLTKRGIQTWDGITGSLLDISNNTVIGAKRLAGKLFTQDNKEVFLKGLSKVREWAVKAFKWFDPVGRLSALGGKVAQRFYQMDVYVEGETEPALFGSRFSKGHYYKKDENGTFTQLNGWNEITGAVYDKDGNVLITEDEYDRGLKTSMGVSIKKLGKGAQKLKKWSIDLFNKAKDQALPHAKGLYEKGKEQFKSDYTPIVSAVDRIYNLLLKHWGIDGESIPAFDPLNPSPPPMGPPRPGPFATPEPNLTEPVNPKTETGEEKETDEDLVNRRKLRQKTRGPAQEEKAPDPYPTPVAEGGEVKVPGTEDDGVPKPFIFKRDYDALRERFPNQAAYVEELRKRYEDRLKEQNGEQPDKPADPNDPNRLNSLADKKNQAEEEKGSQVQDAIISIAENFGFGQKSNEDLAKKKSVGLFGMLGGLLGGIGAGIGKLTSFFGSKILWTGLTNLFKFSTFGISLLPKIATGIGTLGSAIMTLIQTRSLGNAAGDLMDGFRGDDGTPEGKQARKDRKGKRRAKPTAGRKFAGGAGKVGLGLAVSTGAMAAMDSGMIDKDSGMGQTLDLAGDAATVWGVGQMGMSVANMLGFGKGMGGVGTAARTAFGTALRSLPGLIASPVGIAAGIIGYTAYKSWGTVQGAIPKQFLIRMTQYGLADPNGSLSDKLLQIEQMLTDYVVIGNAKASLSQNAPIDKVVQLLIGNIPDQKNMRDALSWFNGRFKPIFMTYMACIDVIGLKSLKEYDDAKGGNVYKVAKQAHEAVSLLTPFPYNITAKFDPENPILDREATIIRVNNYLTELKQYTDTADKLRGTDLKPVETVKGQSSESLERERVQLENQLRDPNAVWEKGTNKYIAHNRLKEVQGEITKLNEAYKAGTAVAEIFVKDMLPDGRPLDMLTAIRVACYGNDENIPWRVEAVLKLERYCEQFFKVTGETAEFTGKVGDLFAQFKDAFRSNDKEAPTWCLWFKDRFLPVLTNYMIQTAKYRKGRPGVVWKTLTVTARYEIAKALVDSRVEVAPSLITSIWYVRASPFKGTESPGRSDKVDKMLAILSEASITARLKDPELESGKTNAQTWANAISPHKPGGGFTENQANLQNAGEYKTQAEAMRGGQFSTSGMPAGNTFNPNGAYKTPENQFNFSPMGGDTETNHLDMSGVTAQQGKDSGVSVPRKLAEQLIIREMLKQGFTDPRAIAEMLALTNYETGGYTRTVENMKYSTPEQLMKTFKEVRSIDQARQLIAMGEVGIANTVYGGGKGASLGNKDPGDGYKYRGRGMVQLTGKGNYEKYGKELGIDLVNKPELLSTDPNVMAQVAVSFFKNSKLLRGISEDGDFGKAARGLNGGNALPDMQKRYGLYMDYLKKIQDGTLGADDKYLTENSGSETPSQMYGNTSPSQMTTPPSYNAGSPVGGSSYGGGGAYSGNQGGGGANYAEPANYANTGTGGGLILKSGETTGGGAHHAGLEALCKIIQNRVPGFKQFTALNDEYHVNKGSKGLHPKGLAADFTLTMGAQGSQRATAIVTEIMRGAGLSPSEYSVINEYMVKTAIGTGGHIHAGFRTPGAAEKFLQASGGNQVNGQDPTANSGGMVQPTPQQGSPAGNPTPGTEGPQTPPVEAPGVSPTRSMPTPPPPPVAPPGTPPEGVGEPDDEYEGKPNFTGLPLPSTPPKRNQELPEGYEANKRRNEAAGHDGSAINDLLAGIKDLVGTQKEKDDQVKQLLAILVKTAQEGNEIAKNAGSNKDEGYVSMR